MQPGFMCIAGIDTKTGRHVRPVLPGRIGVEMLEPNGGPFNMAVEVDLGRAKPKPSPPEVEDCEIRASSVSKLRDLPADEFWQLLQNAGQLRLVEVFGKDLCRHGNTCVLEPATGRASLGCLIPGDTPLLDVCTEEHQGQQKKRIRCHVRDLDGEYFPAVTDFRLYHDDQQTPRSELIFNLNRRMSDGAAAILSVGVTRAMSQGKHWLQVNNIHLQDDPTWRL
jgi:hypothetical protein